MALESVLWKRLLGDGGAARDADSDDEGTNLTAVRTGDSVLKELTQLGILLQQRAEDVVDLQQMPDVFRASLSRLDLRAAVGVIDLPCFESRIAAAFFLDHEQLRRLSWREHHRRTVKVVPGAAARTVASEDQYHGRIARLRCEQAQRGVGTHVRPKSEDHCVRKDLAQPRQGALPTDLLACSAERSVIVAVLPALLPKMLQLRSAELVIS